MKCPLAPVEIASDVERVDVSMSVECVGNDDGDGVTEVDCWNSVKATLLGETETGIVSVDSSREELLDDTSGSGPLWSSVDEVGFVGLKTVTVE